MPSGNASTYRRGFPHGIMFHRFQASEDRARWQGALSPRAFEQILLHVGIEQILPPQEWMSRLGAGRLGERDLCLTFDDGLRCQLEYALPVLERHALKAFWFVYSAVCKGIWTKSEVYSYVAGQTGGMPSLMEEFLSRCPADMLNQLNSSEFRTYGNRLRAEAPFYSSTDLRYRFLRNQPENRSRFEQFMDLIIKERGFEATATGSRLWLTDADLKSLSEQGHSVGLHSYDHPFGMAELDRAQQREQYASNYEHLASCCGEAPRSMSHPLNSYSEVSLAILAELGIECGFRANMIPPPGRGINPSRLELAREDSANLVTAMAGQ